MTGSASSTRPGRPAENRWSERALLALCRVAVRSLRRLVERRVAKGLLSEFDARRAEAGLLRLEHLVAGEDLGEATCAGGP